MRLTVLLLLSFSTLSAVSFDCREATKASEKLIWASTKLGRLDDELASVWRARWAADPGGQAALLAEQKQWLAGRDELRDPREIEALYLDRIHVLRGSPLLTMSSIEGEYGGGQSSILVQGRASQIHILANGREHSHTCAFSGTSTRREGNTFFFDDDKGLDKTAVPNVTFSPASAMFEVSDRAAHCGFSAHLYGVYARVRAVALSFSCRLATSAADRTVCRTPALGTPDLQLHARWEADPTRMSQEESLKATAQRDRCGTSVACLTAWYNSQWQRKREKI